MNALRQLERDLRRAGCTIENGNSHKRILNSEGKFVAPLSASPSDQRSIKNTVSQLRRAGVLPRQDGTFSPRVAH